MTRSQREADPKLPDALDDLLTLWLENAMIINFNTDPPRRHNAHCAALASLVSAVDGELANVCVDEPLTNSYFSYDGRSSSCIDHFVIHSALVPCVLQFHVVDKALNLSNHNPICLHVDINILKQEPENSRDTVGSSIE